MLTFHAFVYEAVPDATRGIGRTFDEAFEALGQLQRLFIEPDGSFVWRGTTGAGLSWQVDGNLVDRGDRLAYAELKGSCPREHLDQLLTALGWPSAPLCFQLPRRGVTLTEAQFRTLAATAEGAI